MARTVKIERWEVDPDDPQGRCDACGEVARLVRCTSEIHNGPAPSQSRRLCPVCLRRHSSDSNLPESAASDELCDSCGAPAEVHICYAEHDVSTGVTSRPREPRSLCTHCARAEGLEEEWPKPWLTATVFHDGKPVVLRLRHSVDTPANLDLYPHLAVVTYRLAQVRPDGLPEITYDNSLADFDAAILNLLEGDSEGLVMLVETCKGERRYYACVSSASQFHERLSSLEAQYPAHSITAQYRPDQAWQFYRRYGSDFGP